MRTKKTGGGAFPEHFDAIPGMTLRDYFAAKSIAPIYKIESKNHYGKPVHMEFEDWIATKAYMMADAMMKAREE